MATRREKVILELQDNFSSGMARAAASTALLDKNLKDLDGSTTRADRGLTALGSPSGGLGRSRVQMTQASNEIDRFSGRMRLLADTAAILGPGLVPIGAVGIPAVAGLATQMGAAALATGTAALAFQGVGETLKAVNDAALEPSAENLEAARIAMQNLSPQARSFVQQLQDMRPAFEGLRDAAAAGLFPGLERGLSDLVRVLPNAERLLTAIGGAAGDVAAEFADGLAGPRGQEFIDFLGAEMPRVLTDLGHTVGNLAGGMAELWMAFTPLNRDTTGWLLDASQSFDKWAQGLSQTQGFREFVAYVRDNGPRVAEAMGAIGDAVLQIVQAAAPMGGPVLAGLTAVANAIAAVADSGAGPAIMATVTALALLNRGMKAFEAIKTSALFEGLGASADGATGKMSGLQRATVGLGAALAGLAIVDAAQGGLEDYAIGVESMTRSLLDLDSASGSMPTNLDGLANSIDRLTNPGRMEALQDDISNILGGIGNEEEYDRAIAQIESLDQALVGLVQGGHADQAKDILGNLGLSPAQMNDLMGLLPGYRDALAGVENQERLTGEAGQEAGQKAASGFNRAKASAEAFRAAIESVNALLEKRASLRDYEQAVDDLATTLRKAGDKARLLNKDGTINIDLPKGREVQEGLDNIASTAVKVAENLRGTQRIQVLNQARRDLIETAEKFGLPRSAIQDLLGMLKNLSGTRATPNVALEGADAVRSSLADVSSWLNSLDGRTATTWVTTRHVNSGGMGPQAADGATVPKSGLPYADRHPYLLADGEEVVSNRYGQADRHRDLLKAINANRLADGGTAGRMSRPFVAAPSVSVAAPNVSVGAPGVRVFVDGKEVRALVRAEIDADHQFRRRLDDRD